MNLAIVGATGLVGSTFLKVLEEKRNIQIDNIYLFASQKSAGKRLFFRENWHFVEELCEKNIVGKHIDYALFSAGGTISKQFAPIFVKYGTKVIDNSSAFRMEENVPLVVPQVNFDDVKNNTGIISNPNCSSIQCMSPLFCLNELFGLKKVHFSTYQAVSGSGMKGVEDLKRSIKGENCEFYPHAIYNNCLPHIDSFCESGFTKEEEKMVNETKKILHLPNLKVCATCVRVPVFNCHSIVVEAECENTINVEMFIDKLKSIENVVVMNDHKNNQYPLATIATGTDNVFVGRIRKDLFDDKTVHFFCVADNVRKGAASNAVEILEKILKSKL